MTSPAAHSLISRRDVLWRRVLDGVLVRVIGSLDNTLLEGTGVAMWGLIDNPVRFDHLCAQLADAHGVAVATVAADLAPTVRELELRGVISLD